MKSMTMMMMMMMTIMTTTRIIIIIILLIFIIHNFPTNFHNDGGVFDSHTHHNHNDA